MVFGEVEYWSIVVENKAMSDVASHGFIFYY